MNELRELTLEDLAASLRTQADQGAAADADAWSTLVHLADELNHGERIDLLTKNRKWLLRKVSVGGFRGARHEVSLALPNLHGVTVLFGENGSGKSSLAEAVRVALEGRTGATHLGDSASVHELWGTEDQRSQGVDKAAITVVLVDEASTDSLTIQATIDEAGVVRNAVLESAEGQTELDASAPAWRVWSDAIRASPPVLAYAELADELQKKKDLQIWLTSCLAMDSASRVFDSQVKVQVDAAISAEKAITAAMQLGIRMVSEADEEARRQGVEGIDALVWAEPSSREGLRAWLKENNLHERQKLDNRLDKDVLTSLPRYGTSFMGAWAAWLKAATKALLTAQVTDSLVEMNARVIDSQQDDNNGVCPTCGTLHTDWRRHLQAEATRLKEAQNAASELKKLVRRSQEELIAPLETCLLVLPPDFDSNKVSDLENLLQEARTTLQETDDLNVDLLSAIHGLAKWSQRPEAKSLMEAALETSGLEHQWRCRRWDAVSPYLSAFETHIDLASKTATLKKARGKWNSHLARIRSERSTSLHALVGPAVAALLGDVGISVSAIDITKSESRLELQNAKGESVELAHLSAGQRNALILGPVIATAESGIFGFSILDDPVHAFDDFRVDKLSSTLSQIGRNQSLVLTTHDARFVEYLRVHATLAFTVLATSRDENGQMALTATMDPPAELIKFSRELASDLVRAQAPEGRAEVTALLRMALDEAFEHLALRHFARLGATPAEEARTTFDEAMTTDDRKKALRVFLKDSQSQLDALTAAWQVVSTSSKRWSKAVHDPASIPDADQMRADIDVAEQTVDMLREIRW